MIENKKKTWYNGQVRYYERLLIYFIYRHVSIAENEIELRARLAFSILPVEMIRALLESGNDQTLGELAEWARRYSAEIEYSEENTAELIFAFESTMIKEMENKWNSDTP